MVTATPVTFQFQDLEVATPYAPPFQAAATQIASPIGPPVGPMPYTAGALWELAICACRQWAFSGSPWLPYYETAHAPKRTF